MKQIEKQLGKYDKAFYNWLDYVAILDSIMKPRGEGARAEFEREFSEATSKVIGCIRQIEKVAKQKIWENFEE